MTDTNSQQETKSPKIESMKSTEKLVENEEEIEEPQKETFFSKLLQKFKKKKDDDGVATEDELAHEPNMKTPLLVWFLIGPEWIPCLLSAFFSGISGAVPVVFQAIFGDILNVVADPNATQDEIKSGINELASYLLIIAAVAGITNGLSSFFSGIGGARLGNRLKKKVYRKLLQQEMGYFDVRKGGVLVKRLSEDTKNIETAYAVKLGTLAQAATQFVVGIILAFVYSWLMTLILLAVGPLMMITMVCVGGFEQTFTKLSQKTSDAASSKAAEVISTMRTVRSMSGEHKEYNLFKSKYSSATKLSLIRAVSKFFGFFIIFMLIWGAAAFVFWFGGLLQTDGVAGQTITLGDQFKCFGALLFGIIGGAIALPLMQDFNKANGSSIEILKIYKREQRVKFRGGDTLDEVRGEIEFKNVDFSYPSRPQIQILQDFSLKIPVGKKTALVGASGSGKSTIVNLVEFFYEVEQGEVLFDGVNINTLDPKWLHQQVGIVTQEPTLFSGSISSNITYGVPEGRKVSQSEIEEAAKMANAHNFISEFKDGYKTLLGESSGLSGGQKQRIAIARMILLNPKVLLLDESTSALDNQSETLVQEALDKLMHGRTTIVIAHRLSTIKDADKIVVMEHGKVVESGTHNELISKGQSGEYYQLAQKQLAFGGSTSSLDKLEVESVGFEGSKDIPADKNSEEGVEASVGEDTKLVEKERKSEEETGKQEPAKDDSEEES